MAQMLNVFENMLKIGVFETKASKYNYKKRNKIFVDAG